MMPKRFKKIVGCFAVAASLSVTSVSIFAADMTWTYDAVTKTVSVKGYGMINDAAELSRYLGDAEKITVMPGVTKTDKNVFSNIEGVSEVTLPDGFLSIGDNSFNMSRNLKKINFPDSLESIGKEAFMGCTALENPIISKGVKSIGANAFADCTSITAFEVSGENQNFVSKDGVIFTKDEKELVMYPSGKTDAEYTIPSGTERIREKAFAYNSNVEKINIPDSLSEIGDYAFYFCDRLSDVTTSEKSGIKTIGSYAFYGCTIRKFSVPYGTESIGEGAFKNCDTLTYIDFPGTVKEIGDNALYGTYSALKTGGYGKAAEYADKYGFPFAETVRVRIDGREIAFDSPAMVKDGCTMVPMRKIFEELGAEVEWNDSTQTAKGEKSGTVCTFSIGDNMLYKNGEAIELIAPAILENNRTLVHVRAIAEAFGADVEWNGDTGLIEIKSAAE